MLLIIFNKNNYLNIVYTLKTGYCDLFKCYQLVDVIELQIVLNTVIYETVHLK
jgi:hypothetical protein